MTYFFFPVELNLMYIHNTASEENLDFKGLTLKREEKGMDTRWLCFFVFFPFK